MILDTQVCVNNKKNIKIVRQDYIYLGNQFRSNEFHSFLQPGYRRLVSSPRPIDICKRNSSTGCKATCKFKGIDDVCSNRGNRPLGDEFHGRSCIARRRVNVLIHRAVHWDSWNSVSNERNGPNPTESNQGWRLIIRYTYNPPTMNSNFLYRCPPVWNRKLAAFSLSASLQVSLVSLSRVSPSRTLKN